jgi:hypothetical protein
VKLVRYLRFARLYLRDLPAALPFKARFVKALIRNGFRTKTVLFYPQRPSSRHVLWKLCHILGYRISTGTKIRADAIIHFEDKTRKVIDPTLAALNEKQPVVNFACTDISKSRVDEAFSAVFGYSSLVDPRTYSGRYVKKSETNALHNYEIFDRPQEPQAGFVYQRFIEAELRNGWYTEYRVPVFHRHIPVIMLKLRPQDDPFQRFALAEAIEKTAVITLEEEDKLLAVCRNIGADYAELDVKRDINDGRLYVLDVNDTPSGIHPRWGKYHYFTSLHRLSAAFRGMIENPVVQAAGRADSVSELQDPISNRPP